MTKSHTIGIRIKREFWTSGAHSVAREQGRFIRVRKWTGKESSREVREYIFNKYISTDSNLPYGYVVTAKEAIGEKAKPHMVFSEKYIDLGSVGSPERKRFYRSVKELFTKYKLKLRNLKLIASYDNHLGIRLQ